MLLLPILTPLIGAGLVFLARSQTARVRWLAFLSSAVATWLIVGTMRVFIPASQQLSVWQPEDVFQTPLTLLLDELSWVATFSCATLLLAVALTSESREGEGYTGMRVLILVYSSLSLMALMGGDLVSLGLGWVLTDLVGFGFLIGSSREEAGVNTLATRGGVLLTSSLLVLAGAALEAGGGGSTGTAVWLWLVAVLLRIGLFPLHVTLPSVVGVRRGFGALLRLFPPAMAVVLLARAPAYDPGELVSGLLLLVAGMGAVAGGIRWGLHEDAVDGRPFFVLGLTAMAPVLFLLSAEGSTMGFSGLVSVLILAGGSISIYEAHVAWHKAWPVLVSVLILGPPWSAGAWIHEAVVGSDSGSVVYGPAIFILTASLSMLAVGTFRLSREAETSWVSGEDAVRVTYTIGQTLPLVAIVLIGLAAGAQLATTPALTFVGLLVLTVPAIVVLRRLVSPRRQAILNLMGNLLEFGGVNRLAWGGMRIFGRIIRTLGIVLEGRSAMLWVLVILMMVGLFLANGGT